MERITLTVQQQKILVDHAEREYPKESCAILFGHSSNGKVRASKIFLTENMDDTTDSFTIPEEQLIRAYDLAEKEDTCIVGIFHSHPHSEAYPSSTDMEFMHVNPVVWVIYSGSVENFRAYTLNGTVKEVPILWES